MELWHAGPRAELAAPQRSWRGIAAAKASYRRGSFTGDSDMGKVDFTERPLLIGKIRCSGWRLESPRAQDFVAAQNARTVGLLGDPRSLPLFGRLLETETTDTDGDPLRKLPQVTELGGQFYDFWSDARHPRGVWRRTTLQSFLSDAPDWEVVLDLAELGRAEGESFVWRGYDALLEDGRDSWTVTRAMVCLSRGGADAFVAREFDLVRKRFVPEDEGGFVVPEGKTVLSYRSREVLLVSTDFGPGSLTSAGYPRVVKAWQRGTPLTDASVVYDSGLASWLAKAIPMTTLLA
ncbi:unnamed protein product [Symbiodinium natans]|uniref:Uncharacterized protein n=1 Tax=Symbiodinium natans TaxID=878477 RepID=A0A812S897_9DINO|nr:unnamed protein product [Symbiodinium natans]